MEIDVTQIVVAVIGLLSVILTSVVVPLIKAKLSQEQWTTLMKYAIAGVQAAEIIFGAGNGEQKLEWAIKYIQDEAKSHGITFDPQSIRVAVENAWKQLGFDKH